MALPELLLPDGTPAFLADGHSIELTPMYADVPTRTGHGRRRRVFTVVPRIVSVGLQLTAAQMLAFHNWFEGPLQAGAQSFSAQVANQGPGLLWWQARFVEPYTAYAGEAGASFRVRARLLLVGSGTAITPYTPAMNAATVIALVGSAVMTAPVNLAADSTMAMLPLSTISADTTVAMLIPADLAAGTTVALLMSADLAADTVVALMSTGFTGYELREDAAFVLREDNSKLQRE